jgi:hypothetical protein
MAKKPEERADLSGARDLFDYVVKRMQDVGGPAGPGQLFPDGIDLISLKVEVATFTVEFTVAGPKSREALSDGHAATR